MTDEDHYIKSQLIKIQICGAHSLKVHLKITSWTSSSGNIAEEGVEKNPKSQGIREFSVTLCLLKK